MNEEDIFQKTLDADPDDFFTRGVFAEWLSDRDDPRAEGYMALSSCRRVPSLRGAQASSYWAWVKKSNCWGHEGPFGEGPMKAFALPDDWIALTATSPELGHTNSIRGWRSWPTRRECENAAAVAFAELPTERQAQLLRGEI